MQAHRTYGRLESISLNEPTISVFNFNALAISTKVKKTLNGKPVWYKCSLTLEWNLELASPPTATRRWIPWTDSDVDCLSSWIDCGR